MKTKLLTIVAALAMATGCNVENEYSSRYVFLRFDNSRHLDQTLAAAMNSVVTNIFCRIYVSGASRLSFVNNQAPDSPTTVQLSEIELQYGTPTLGISNANGIIVGYGLGGVFYCYDALCAYCYENNKRQLLSMNTSGIATCSNCHRQYDLTNDGLCSEGGRLYRYQATTTGPQGVLNVSNHN